MFSPISPNGRRHSATNLLTFRFHRLKRLPCCSNDAFHSPPSAGAWAHSTSRSSYAKRRLKGRHRRGENCTAGAPFIDCLYAACARRRKDERHRPCRLPGVTWVVAVRRRWMSSRNDNHTGNTFHAPSTLSPHNQCLLALLPVVSYAASSTLPPCPPLSASLTSSPEWPPIPKFSRHPRRPVSDT